MNIRSANRFVRTVFLRGKYIGITLPPWGVFVAQERMGDKRLIAHESAHWKQYEELGLIRFYWLYLTGLIRYGYWAHPMEVEAREKSG